MDPDSGLHFRKNSDTDYEAQNVTFLKMGIRMHVLFSFPAFNVRKCSFSHILYVVDF
jgi:hypothetical protein